MFYHGFTQFSTRNGRLAASDLFHMFTQSIKFYTFHYHVLKVQSCILHNDEYMIDSAQILNTEIFAIIAVLVFKLLSRKVFVYNLKRQ